MEFLTRQNLDPGFMVALPAAPRSNAQTVVAPALTLLVKGFNTMEHRLLNGTVLLSQRRQPRLALASEDNAQLADVVMIDGTDPAAMKWASEQTWLKHKAAIWVDAAVTSRTHIALRRPVQWTSLPMILARALEQVPQKATETLVTNRPSAPSQRSVLIVDDSMAVRGYLRSMLEPRGLTVTDVASAEEGVDAAGAASYACILMDVLMPGIDGYEACRRIKGRARSGTSAAIVMLTSKSSPFDRIRGKMAGCDAYLTKPVDPQTLYDVLSRFIPGPAQSAAAIPPRTWVSSAVPP